VQLCGDAHLSNFGAFASPERRLVFDVNDFDETLPGPFEWDVKRLAASLAVAGRDNGFGTKERRKIVLAAAGSYRTAMRGFAGQPFLEVWYAHLDIEQAIGQFRSQMKAARFKETEKLLAKAHTADSTKALGKLTALEVTQHVHVVQDQHHQRGHRRKRRPQRGDDRAGHRAPRGSQRVEHPLIDRLVF
jgi:uncharacterized protein (DUF2252 family)